MLKSILLAAALVAVVLALFWTVSGCTPPATAADAGPCPTVVTTHVVTESQCAPIELVLDGGITKTACLRADQLNRAIEEMP